MRAAILSLTLAVPAFVAACGDDNNGGNPDAPKPIDAPDAPPPPKVVDYDSDEGGEVRLEYVRFAAGNAATRLTSFLYKNPGSTKHWPYPNLNGCTDVSTDVNWPTATSTDREYLDGGKVIISGGPKGLEIPRRATMGTDPFGRTHPANAWNFHFLGAAGTDGADYMTPNASLDVFFSGSAEMPAQAFDDVLFVPPDFALTPAPQMPIPPTPIPAGTAQTFTWEANNGTPPPDVEVQSLVAFTGANGPAILCIEPNDGSITVPAQFIDIVRTKYPTGGTLARQTLTHVVRELVDNNGPTGRRIDFISVWCYATSFTVP